MFLLFLLFVCCVVGLCNPIETTIQTFGFELIAKNGTTTPICLPNGNSGNVTVDQILFGSGSSFQTIPAVLRDGMQTVSLNCSLSNSTLGAFVMMKGTILVFVLFCFGFFI